MISIVGEACGSLGMTGGQSIDLASEGQVLSREDLHQMHGLKTGALIRASVMSASCLANGISHERMAALRDFSEAVGLAFQIRDDILDVEGQTDVIGKNAGADSKKSKATWPAMFGMDESRRRCAELLESGLDSLGAFGDSAASLRWLAHYVVDRSL
jgi:geranylgeranyl pyrophosphate synthase